VSEEDVTDEYPLEKPMGHVIQPQVDCNTASEFMEALSPLGPNFKEAKPTEPWLFRGQSGDYPLIPSLFRKNNNKLASLTSHNISTNPGRLKAERDLPTIEDGRHPFKRVSRVSQHR
jgi:hypothetical protein